MLILASQSPARRAMLANADIGFEAIDPLVDEMPVKAGLRDRGIGQRDLADALAELKATKLSRRYPDRLVLGADQTLGFGDGEWFDKPTSRAELIEQLTILSGTSHELFSAAVVARGGQPVWRHVERCRMQMRPLSRPFIEAYVDAEGGALLGCVGGYRIEGRGIQLFSRIEGSHFAIMGLPLLPLLDMLRQQGLLAT